MIRENGRDFSPLPPEKRQRVGALQALRQFEEPPSTRQRRGLRQSAAALGRACHNPENWPPISDSAIQRDAFTSNCRGAVNGIVLAAGSICPGWSVPSPPEAGLTVFSATLGERQGYCCSTGSRLSRPAGRITSLRNRQPSNHRHQV